MISERGESFVEVIVTVAIVAMATAAILGATVVAAHRFGPDANTTALRSALRREMRVAVDLVKYQGSAIAPTSVATSVPVPGASPLAAHFSVATTSLASGQTSITLSGSLDNDPSATASISSTLSAPAPLPSSTITTVGNAPQ